MHMKHKIVLVALFFLFFIQIGFSQSNSIVGKWKVSFSHAQSQMPPEELADYNSLESSLQQKIQTDLEHSGFDFKSNGRYTLFQYTQITEQGNWVITNNGQTLKITPDGFSAIYYTILENTSQRFLIKKTDETKSTLYTPY